MAINLARVGGVPRGPGLDVNPFAEFDAARRARRDEQRAQIDLARARREDEAAMEQARQAKEQSGILGRFVQERDFGQTAPVGVVNPRFLGDMGTGPHAPGAEPPRDVSSTERRAVLDLAKINPMMAEGFRKSIAQEKEQEKDWARKAAEEQRKEEKHPFELGKLLKEMGPKRVEPGTLDYMLRQMGVDPETATPDQIERAQLMRHPYLSAHIKAADDIVAGIRRGEPPDFTGLRAAMPFIRAQLSKPDPKTGEVYNMRQAKLEWDAAQRLTRTLNSSNYPTFRAKIGSALGTINYIRDKIVEYESLGSGRFPRLNQFQQWMDREGLGLRQTAQQKADGVYADPWKNAPGSEQEAQYRELYSLITDFIGEYASVMRMGGQPTEKSMQLAEENINLNWGPKALLRAIGATERQLLITRQAMEGIVPIWPGMDDDRGGDFNPMRAFDEEYGQ